MRYKSKPKIVEAEQWFPGKLVDGVYGSFENQHKCVVCLPEGSYDVVGPAVITLQGQVVRVKPGEWIITERDGIHHYPCDPKEFEKLYEPA